MQGGLLQNLVGLVIAAGCAYWLYTDSGKRGMNQIVWGICGFLFSIFTVIVYLIMRKPLGGGN